MEMLANFYKRALEDACIGPVHSSLYMALFYLYVNCGYAEPVCFRRLQVMTLAKIAGIATYHRCINDLVRGGYIRYESSFIPGVGNRVWMRADS